MCKGIFLQTFFNEKCPSTKIIMSCVPIQNLPKFNQLLKIIFICLNNIL